MEQLTQCLYFRKWAEPAFDHDYFHLCGQNRGNIKIHNLYQLTMACYDQKSTPNFGPQFLKNKNAPDLDILQSYSHTYHQ